jgi:hypothetical protein
MSDETTAKDVHEGSFSRNIENEIRNIKQQIIGWKTAKNQKNNDNQVLQGKQKITRAQWQQEAFMIRMQKIAKRRRGFMKQQMLEEKALKIKGKYF